LDVELKVKWQDFSPTQSALNLALNLAKSNLSEHAVFASFFKQATVLCGSPEMYGLIPTPFSTIADIDP